MFYEILAEQHHNSIMKPEDKAFMETMQKRAELEIKERGVRRKDGKVGSKMGIAAFNVSSVGNGLSVNPYIILVEEGFNHRFPDSPANIAHALETAVSISKRGLTIPLEVYWCPRRKRIVLIGGHFRLDGIMYSNGYLGSRIEAVNIFVSLGKDNDELRAAKVIVGGEGKPSTIFENAAHVRKMMAFTGKDYKGIADTLAKPHETVLGWLQTDDALGPDLRRMIDAGTVALNTALSFLEVNGGDRAQTIKDILRGFEISVAESEAKGKPTVRKAMPRHIEQGRLGVKLPPLRRGLTQMFSDGSIKVHREPGRVVYSMDPKVHDLVNLLLKRVEEELPPDPDGVDEPVREDYRQ